MKMRNRICLLTTLLSAALTTDLGAQGTRFHYQGLLTSNGNPSGSHDFIFRLCDSDVAPAMKSVTNLNVQVDNNGVFATDIDFGPGWFDGSPRWLQIEVRKGNSGNFTV